MLIWHNAPRANNYLKSLQISTAASLPMYGLSLLNLWIYRRSETNNRTMERLAHRHQASVHGSASIPSDS